MLDKKKLKDLPLRDRLEALRRIQDEREKELDEAKTLMDEAESQLEVEDATSNVEVPVPEPVDISKLFLPEGDGLEATAEIEQIQGEDFFQDYGRIFEGLAEEGFYQNILIHPQPEKIETRINPSHYTLQSKQDVEASTTSVGIIEQVKKYTKG